MNAVYLFLLLPVVVQAVDNGIGLTPPMVRACMLTSRETIADEAVKD
jgi:hypothetical protein